MPVSATRGTTASTIANFAPTLITNMTNAGWTVLYASPAAIGTGTLSAPKFDSTPTVSTSAGRVIMQMPAGSLDTRWLAEIEFVWGTSTAQQGMYSRTGTGWDGTSALTNPGTHVKLDISFGNNALTEWYTGANENGFYVSLHGPAGSSAAFFMSLERKRNFSGTVLDEINTTIFSPNNVTISGFGGVTNPGLGSNLTRTASVEYSPMRIKTWSDPGSSATASSHPVTMNGAGGTYGLPVGPIMPSGEIGGFPRLWKILCENDSVAGQDIKILEDGVARLFYPASGAVANQPYRGGGRLAFAKE